MGLYRMLQSEYRHVRSRHVETDGAATDEQLCRWIPEELSADDEPAEVAYRGECATWRRSPSHRGRARRARLPGGPRAVGDRWHARPRLLTARHFVARYGVRKLVLTGREELPPRAEWAAHIAEDGPLGRKLRPLAELAAQGVALEAVAVPLDEKEALAKVLADVRLRLGPVGGVIHSAGFTDFENPAFVRKPQTGVARVLAPKVFGLDALLECFRDEPLGLFVLYSSVAAAVPALAVGQSDYAMANAYLDAVAEARPYGLPLLSVQWPSWKDTGMGEARSAAYQASGLASLTDAQGLALLDRALESGARVVMPVLPRPGAGFSAERLTARRLDAPPAAPSPRPRQRRRAAAGGRCGRGRARRRGGGGLLAARPARRGTALRPRQAGRGRPGMTTAWTRSWSPNSSRPWPSAWTVVGRPVRPAGTPDGGRLRGVSRRGAPDGAARGIRRHGHRRHGHRRRGDRRRGPRGADRC
ncbi:KR domain-containing protein [Streptomyces sp. ARC32]